MISTSWLATATSCFVEVPRPPPPNPKHPASVYLPPITGVERALGRICRVVTIDSEEDRDRNQIRREVVMTFEDGWSLRLWHPQDCCEDVWLDDVVGDVGDLIGHPLVLAEHSSNAELPCAEWHYYRFATVKGYVTFSFRGEDEGYYTKEVVADWTYLTPTGSSK